MFLLTCDKESEQNNFCSVRKLAIMHTDIYRYLYHSGELWVWVEPLSFQHKDMGVYKIDNFILRNLKGIVYTLFFTIDYASICSKLGVRENMLTCLVNIAFYTRGN